MIGALLAFMVGALLAFMAEVIFYKRQQPLNLQKQSDNSNGRWSNKRTNPQTSAR